MAGEQARVPIDLSSRQCQPRIDPHGVAERLKDPLEYPDTQPDDEPVWPFTGLLDSALSSGARSR